MGVIPYGYKMIDGKLVADKLESEIVSWTYEKRIYYSEHPPAVLVEGVIEEYKNSKHRVLSYEKAEKKVSSEAISDYIDREIRLRLVAYDLYGEEESVEDLRNYLTCPLDELNKDEIIEAYKRRQRNRIPTLSFIGKIG